jgi:amidase
VGDPVAVALAGLRLAVYTDDDPNEPTPETMAAVERAARALADAGVIVAAAAPAGIAAARSITERHWRRDELNGRERDQLLAEWDVFRSRMLAFMEGYDAILCPVQLRPAPPHPSAAPPARPAPPPRRGSARCNYCLPYSLTGWPCAVVRAGTAPGDLPIGVQVVARPWREEVALALAQRVEAAGGGWRPPALF